MLKSLSVILGASLLLTACGGGGGGGGGNKSSAAAISSSIAAVSSVVSSSSSSIVSSSSPSSVVSSSSVSSISGPAVIDLPVASWYAEKEAGFSAGVVAVTTQWQGAGYYLNQPIPELEFATLEVTVAVDNAFKASGSGLSLWAVVDAAPWPGKNDCAVVESSALVEGVDTKVTCVLDSGGVFAQTAAAVKLGIQATTTPAGTFTIKSARILLTKASDFSSSSSSAVSSSQSSSSANSADVSSSVSSAASSISSAQSSSTVSSSSVASSTSNVVLTLSATTPQWYGKDGATVVQSGSYLEVGYFAEYDVAGIWVAPASAAIEGNTIEIDVDVTSGFKASGGALQIFAFVDGGAYPSESDCGWLINTAMVPDTTQTVSCLIDTENNDFAQTTNGVEIQLRARGSAPNGTVKILGGRVIAP